MKCPCFPNERCDGWGVVEVVGESRFGCRRASFDCLLIFWFRVWGLKVDCFWNRWALWTASVMRNSSSGWMNHLILSLLFLSLTTLLEMGVHQLPYSEGHKCDMDHSCYILGPESYVRTYRLLPIPCGVMRKSSITHDPVTKIVAFKLQQLTLQVPCLVVARTRKLLHV